TVISAINAMTMAPARAVSLIKPHAKGHHETREALPRLGVAILGGLLAYWLLMPLAARAFGLPIAAHHGDPVAHSARELVKLWSVRSGVFLVGGIAGWLFNPVVNFLLLRFFDGFNWV